MSVFKGRLIERVDLRFLLRPSYQHTFFFFGSAMIYLVMRPII